MAATTTAPVLDSADWVFDLVLSQDDGTPFNLTGSTIRVVLRTYVGFEVVDTCTTDGGTGSLIVTDAVNGKVSLRSKASVRTWRLSPAVASLPIPMTVIGDVLRWTTGAPSSETDALGEIRFLVRAGTTERPSP